MDDAAKRGEKWAWMQSVAPLKATFSQRLMMTGEPYKQVYDWPTYDNGKFVVLEIVPGLEWAVHDYNFKRLREVPLDKYEAIRIADEFLEVARATAGE